MKVMQIGNLDKPREKFDNPQPGRVYSIDGIAPTLTTCGGGNLEPKILIEEQPTSQAGTVIGGDNTADGKEVNETAKRYRIRKLTPRECWWLMDFSDEDFDKAAEINSNSALYKQAGNSIVVNVLVAIMGQMFEGKEKVYQERAKNFKD